MTPAKALGAGKRELECGEKNADNEAGEEREQDDVDHASTYTVRQRIGQGYNVPTGKIKQVGRLKNRPTCRVNPSQAGGRFPRLEWPR